MTDRDEAADGGHQPVGSGAHDDGTSRLRWLALAAGLVGVAVAIVALILIARNDDTDTVPTTDTAATAATSLPAGTPAPPTSAANLTETSAPATTVAAATSSTTADAPTTTVPPPPPDPVAGSDMAIWPQAGSSMNFDDPVAAALSFAEDLVGFTEVTASEFRAGDSRSGEVELTSRPSGPVTVALVRQVGPDDSWSVIGAVAEHIRIEQPETLATISSPLTVDGESSAFEGTVSVRLIADGVGAPIVEGFVTGGAGPELGPFSGTFSWDVDAVGGSSLLLISESPEDGSVVEVSAISLFLSVAA
jgi:hypothetical protein